LSAVAKPPAVRFTALIKSIKYSIDVAGDKQGKMTLEFYATTANQDAINRLQVPDAMVDVEMALQGE
jgi:hypothetical protein